MAARTPTVFLDPDSEEPVYLQIAHGLMREIHRGRFRPGDPLPGHRTLAEELGVARNTALAAYRELQEEGWLRTSAGGASTVAPRLPAHLPARAAAATGPQAPADASAIGFDLGDAARTTAAARGRLLEVASGMPDPRLLPGAALARAYRRALAARGAALADHDPQGHPALREALSRMLAGARAVAADPGRILVTRGTQMALVLASQALFAPGERVAVEALGGRGAWEAFARTGARCLPVPVDGDGLVVEELERIAAAGPLRAVLVTPRRQYPSLAVLSAERRARLLRLAAERRIALIEIDQDAEFQLDGRAVAPLVAEDRAGVVVHVGTLSKVFTPDVRLGYVVGPPPLVRRMTELRAALDRHGDPALERAVAELIEDGEIGRHLNRMHGVYRARRDALCGALRRELGGAVDFAAPAGGLALWVRVGAEVDVDAWSARALEQGVAFEPGRRFAFDGGPIQALRLGFARYPERELEEVVRRMRTALGEAA